jgi:hypothetical protein
VTFLPWTVKGKQLRNLESSIVYYEERIAFVQNQRDNYCGLAWLDLGEAYYDLAKMDVVQLRKGLAILEHTRRRLLGLPVHYT